MISQQDAEHAIHNMIENAEAIAQAKAELMRTESYVQSVEALEFLAVKEGSVDFKKMTARTSARYEAANKAHFEAAANYERLRHLQEAYRATVSCYQTQCANQRIANEAAHHGAPEPRRKNPRSFHQRGYERSPD